MVGIARPAPGSLHFRTNRSSRLAPAHQGMKIGTAHTPLDSGAVSGFGGAFAGKTKWGRRVDVGGGIAVGVLSRNVSAWIPAFAGMTNWGAGTTSAGAVAFRYTRGRVTSFSY